jgi:hypothetical protein
LTRSTDPTRLVRTHFSRRRPASSNNRGRIWRSVPNVFKIATSSNDNTDINRHHIGLVMDTRPESPAPHRKSRNCDVGNLALQEAIDKGLGREAIEHIVNSYPTDERRLEIRSGSLGMDEMSALLPLMSRVETFGCAPTKWKTFAAFLFTLQSLQENKSITNITRLAIPAEFKLQEELAQAHTAVCRFLCRNTTVKSIVLSTDGFLNPTTYQDDVWLSTFSLALRVNQCIRSLTLTMMSLSEDALINFMADGSAPESLTLCFVHVKPKPFDNSRLQMPGEWEYSRVQRLEVLAMDWRGTAFATDLPVMLQRMPLVRRLVYGLTPEENTFTSQAVAIIEREKILELILLCPDLDCEPICEALKHNKTMQSCSLIGMLGSARNCALLLGVLENYNTTLKKCCDPFFIRQSEHLLYWTTLNMFGRAEAREPNTSLKAFVGLLSKACCRSELKTLIGQVNVCFGLLRECPSLWTAGSPIATLDRGKASLRYKTLC